MRTVGRTASCINTQSGRSYDGIVGVDLDGRVRMWTDRDADDGEGNDIVPRAAQGRLAPDGLHRLTA